MMTKQEVFDTVYHHLLAQGCKSLDMSDECCYRSPNGLKCAAGVLIKDEHYTEGLEGSNTQTPEVTAALVKSGVPKEALDLIRMLQAIHDDCWTGEWPEHLAELAAENNLQVPA